MSQEKSGKPTKRRRFAKVFAILLLCPLALALAGFSAAWVPMGTSPDDVRASRMASSPNYSDGSFVNAQPMWNDYWGWFSSIGELSDFVEPAEPLPVVENTAELLKSPPNGSRVTWLGHSTVLFEIDGKRILTDPIWGESPFPIPSAGPKRWYGPPLTLDELSRVDAVLISHDHYDHLDQPTIVAMSSWDTTFITPLGVGAHLEYWGVPPEKIVELDWWEEHMIGGLRIVATPARHASGRHVLDQNRTLWAGYAILGSEHRFMFSGDTGLFDDMETIGEKYGPFDLVMIEVGAYHRTWPDWHTGPEQAIRGHQMMRGKLFMPIHWGLFNLALHGWTEPAERTWAAAEKAGVQLVTPRPGEPFEIGSPPEPKRWWPDVPWQTAEEHPIISTRNGDPNHRYE
jgi:L-ascorbate metabolism protein UlaG (beta-lactamase superfamily)